MTKQEEELLRKLRELSRQVITIEPAIVKSVNESELSCVVELLNETEIPDVRLKSAIDGITDGLVQIPSVESIVLVATIGDSIGNRFVLAFGEVEKVLFFGGSNGGLINIQTLIENLNKTNDVVNAIKDSLLNWAPVPNDGGAALKALAATNIGIKMTGDFSSIEDEKVKH